MLSPRAPRSLHTLPDSVGNISISRSSRRELSWRAIEKYKVFFPGHGRLSYEHVDAIRGHGHLVPKTGAYGPNLAVYREYGAEIRNESGRSTQVPCRAYWGILVFFLYWFGAPHYHPRQFEI